MGNLLTSGDGAKMESSVEFMAGSPDEIRAGINALVQQERVVIFSKKTCPYCFEAKKVFQNLGTSYSVIELNRHPQGDKIQDTLSEMTGARTVPRVFVGGRCIGGASDTKKMMTSGELQKLVHHPA